MRRHISRARSSRWTAASQCNRAAYECALRAHLDARRELPFGGIEFATALRKFPVMSLDILGLVNAPAPEFVVGLGNDIGASRLGPREVAIDAVNIHLHRLSYRACYPRALAAVSACRAERDQAVAHFHPGP